MTGIKKSFRMFLGFLFILIGITGILLPLINGLLFILAGLLILSIDSPKLENFLDNLVNKNLHLEKMYRKVKLFIKKIFN